MSSKVVLTGIFVFPIKSCAGISLSQSQVSKRGLQGDRNWMIVDQDGLFVTQRTVPKMALIKTNFDDGDLTLTFEKNSFQVKRSSNEKKAKVKVWSDEVSAIEEDSTISSALSDFLGLKCRLVRFPDDEKRIVSQKYASPTDEVGFADGFSFLLAARESLADLNSRMAKPLPMDRFRPNLVVSGGGVYAEDKWKKIRIGEIVFDVSKPCARCPITTVDQEKGVSGGKEPLQTLATYRRENGKVMFGQNLIHHGEGLLRVGMNVEILS